MDLPEQSTKGNVVLQVIKDPHWWMREVVTALIVGTLVAAGTIVGQKWVDDTRADREQRIADEQNRHREQLEDLRFVRDRSWDLPDEARRFAEFDLAGQNLVGLRLTGSDFALADLSGANLAESDLTGSNFAHANLSNADLSRTTLQGVYFGADRVIVVPGDPGADLTEADLTKADLTDADLSHANLTGAKLIGADLTNIFYDRGTVWPQGFSPPPSRPKR